MVNISRLGTINGAAADGSAEYDLFLKVFSGEVLATFQETNLFMDKHMVRTISSGKSAQFPVIGTASTKYAVPGESIVEDAGYLSQIKHNEKIISVDQFLTSSVMVADADELMNHYDVRSTYAQMIGRALAKQMDTNIIGTVYAAAHEATPSITGGKAGTRLSGGSATDSATIVSKAFDAARILDENDCPPEDRYFVVRPAAYYALTQDTTVLDRDYSTNPADLAEGRVYKIAGMTIVKTNNMPSTDLSATAEEDGIRNDPFGGDGKDYTSINWSDVHQLAFHKSAVGTVKLQDLSVESEYQLERLATLMVAKYMCGHGILRPESAVAIETTV
jgi:hypothetical protein